MRSIGRKPLDFNRAFAVHGHPQGIHHAPDHGFAHRHRGDAAGGAHQHAFTNLGIIAHDNDAHGVTFQVEGDAEHAVIKLHQLLSLHRAQTAHTGNAVAGFQDGAHIAHFHFRFECFDLFL